ncbi:MAG: hypothetical protein ACYDHG_00090 [Desulfomonilaceae bacterium]
MFSVQGTGMVQVPGQDEERISEAGEAATHGQRLLSGFQFRRLCKLLTSGTVMAA